jgi:hypothetical protein
MQSFYKFYQKKILQESSNTDDLLIEVFDRANLDGVTITDGFSSVSYQFEDTVEGEKYSYEITVYGNNQINTRNYAATTNFLDKYGDLYSQFKMKYPKSFDKADIYLTITKDRQRSFNASNLGNQVFVYGKLIACIQDMISKHKPLFLKFSGAQRSMDLVYDKFIKMSQKVYPQDAYVPYLDDYYIRKEVYDLIPDDADLQSAKKEREGYLKDVRHLKNLDNLNKLNKRRIQDSEI